MVGLVALISLLPYLIFETTEDLKGQFLKAEKKARDYFTHDISAIPQPQEALALVAEACDLSMVLLRLKNPETKLEG